MYMNTRTTPGHSESLYIEMRDPRLSFSSRAAKTNKGSPTPPARHEAVITHHITWGVHSCRAELSIAFACVHCNRMSCVREYHTQPSVGIATDEICTHDDIPPEVLRDLEKLVPVPSPAMLHADKAKAGPCTSAHIRKSCTYHTPHMHCA